MSSFDGVCAGDRVCLWAGCCDRDCAGPRRRAGGHQLPGERARGRGAADLCRAANATVKVVQADVAVNADCRRAAAAASDWGRLDILVNNASTTNMWQILPTSMRFPPTTSTSFTPTDARR